MFHFENLVSRYGIFMILQMAFATAVLVMGEHHTTKSDYLTNLQISAGFCLVNSFLILLSAFSSDDDVTGLLNYQKLYHIVAYSQYNGLVIGSMINGDAKLNNKWNYWMTVVCAFFAAFFHIGHYFINLRRPSLEDSVEDSL